ncbi:hypothetical protein TcG_09492 [Trypanosoma cruzi]|nr:hypothetical protein TcG_09492 [Trypanosoma cruzi]
MLKSFQDTYIEYLKSTLHEIDVDVSIVGETLVSLGLDERSISDILGGSLHACAKGASSVSSVSSDRDWDRRLRKGPEECSTISSTSRKSLLMPQREGMLRVDIGKFDREQIGGAALPASSSSSLSVIESPRAGRGKFLHHGHDASCNVEEEEEEALTSPATAWDDPIVTPDRRDSYKEHLEALEKLLGVVWRPVAGGGDDSVPLEIRSFLCRERVQNFLLSQFKARGIALPASPPKRNTPHQRFKVRHEEKKQPEGSRNNSRRGRVKHSQCIRHFGSLLETKKSPQVGFRWQCEFCARLDDKPILPSVSDHPRQPQVTPAAMGNACGVKMRPQAVNTVGCGRICTKLLATTLLYREDRVKKALAYRDGWNASGCAER